MTTDQNDLPPAVSPWESGHAAAQFTPQDPLSPELLAALPAPGAAPYVLVLDDEGLNRDLHPDLVQAARDLSVYASTRWHTSGAYPDFVRTEVEALRCRSCDGVLPSTDLAGRVGHLTLCHGWRMNGQQYDDQNRVIGGEVDQDADAAAGVVPN
jgi:hypothetical protein